MNRFSLSRLPGVSRALLAVFATGAVFTTGCANMATTATGSTSMDTGGSLTGRIHGGNQPVAFATVYLWAAGEGTAAPAKILATTTSADDGAGSFSFTGGSYTCPSNNPLVYVIATGGNTINTHDHTVNNSASVFLASFGRCNSINSSSFVDMTEVTTVATMAALQQYFTPTGVAGTFATDGSGLAKTAIVNASALISNMVDASTGTAVVSKSQPAGSITAGYGYSGTSVTVTPESSKINVLANILSACINNATSSSSACTTLFNNATPPEPATTAHGSGITFSTASDVLQALYYMLTNPTNGSTSNLANLFNLSPATGAPFQPVLASAPSDWTIGIAYTSTSTCNNNGGTTGHFIQSAQDLAVDTYGNVWIANNETGGNLSQISPVGVPITCVAVGSGATTGITIDSLASTGNISNVWVADSGSNNVYRYHPGNVNPSNYAPNPNPIITFPTASGHNPFAIAADGSGNVYFTSPSDATLYEIPGGATATAAVTPIALTTPIGTNPSRVVVDPTSVWTTSGSTFITRTPYSGTATQFTTAGPAYGISVSATVPAAPSGTKNYVYVSADGSSNTLSQLSGSGNNYSLAGNWPVAAGTTPVAVAADGAQNVWTIGNGSNSLLAFGANQQAISPSSGILKSASYLNQGRALAIDQSGNVWISLDNANGITEIVGAAVPVFAPAATALKTGSQWFQANP